MLSKPKKWLVVAPHTDDWELGCGATVARLVEEGHEIHILILSLALESIPDRFSCNDTRQEALASCDLFGIPEKRVLILNYPVRRFPEWRQAILEKLVSIRKDLNPDVVIGPWEGDRHQDHEVTAREISRAFRGVSKLNYHVPWYDGPTMESNLTISVHEHHIERKMLATSLYKTQSHRPPLAPEMQWMPAICHGVRAGCNYAERLRIEAWVE